MNTDLTKGPIKRTMLIFAIPMILGNLLQQCYNIADTMIVSRYLGPNALAAVGSSFTLMTFITSILLGLCMGSGTLFSIFYGKHEDNNLKESMFASFLLIALLSVLLNILAFAGMDGILALLQVPKALQGLMKEYLHIIFIGIPAIFLYNYFSCLLRAIGNSIIPLLFLGVSALLNIVLDLFFVCVLERGIAGAAEATILAQYIAGIGVLLYTWIKFPSLHLQKRHCKLQPRTLKQIAGFSILTCIQQSIMNFGILMVQGLVNSFGTSVMASFAAAVKIDAFAYMPVQDFGNAFSTFIAQNHGADKKERIQEGIHFAIRIALLFCLCLSVLIWIFARPLMLLFIDERHVAIVLEGVRYLRIEGAFYCGIGILFLLYGYYRAVGRPSFSLILTIFSLGTRVVLAYALSSIPSFGVAGIWWSVPIGWILADVVGLLYMKKQRNYISLKET